MSQDQSALSSTMAMPPKEKNRSNEKPDAKAITDKRQGLLSITLDYQTKSSDNMKRIDNCSVLQMKKNKDDVVQTLTLRELRNIRKCLQGRGHHVLNPSFRSVFPHRYRRHDDPQDRIQNASFRLDCYATPEIVQEFQQFLKCCNDWNNKITSLDENNHDDHNDGVSKKETQLLVFKRFELKIHSRSLLEYIPSVLDEVCSSNLFEHISMSASTKASSSSLPLPDMVASSLRNVLVQHGSRLKSLSLHEIHFDEGIIATDTLGNGIRNATSLKRFEFTGDFSHPTIREMNMMLFQVLFLDNVAGNQPIQEMSLNLLGLDLHRQSEFFGILQHNTDWTNNLRTVRLKGIRKECKNALYQWLFLQKGSSSSSSSSSSISTLDLAFRHAVRGSNRHRRHFHHDCNDVLSVLSHYTSLEHLRIASWGPPPNDRFRTFSTILILLSQCPNLKHVTLPNNDIAVPGDLKTLETAAAAAAVKAGAMTVPATEDDDNGGGKDESAERSIWKPIQTKIETFNLDDNPLVQDVNYAFQEAQQNVFVEFLKRNPQCISFGSQFEQTNLYDETVQHWLDLNRCGATRIFWEERKKTTSSESSCTVVDSLWPLIMARSNQIFSNMATPTTPMMMTTPKKIQANAMYHLVKLCATSGGAIHGY